MNLRPSGYEGVCVRNLYLQYQVFMNQFNKLRHIFVSFCFMVFHLVSYFFASICEFCSQINLTVGASFAFPSQVFSPAHKRQITCAIVQRVAVSMVNIFAVTYSSLLGLEIYISSSDVRSQLMLPSNLRRNWRREE